MIENKNKINHRDWFDGKRAIAHERLIELKFLRYMEVRSRLIEEEVFSRSKLMEVAEKSTIHTFGWPIAVFMHRAEYKPRPDNDNKGGGIFADISIKEESFDYWSINKNAHFYLLKSLFEDKRKPGSIFFNTRIIRITETLLYLKNLYFNLGINKKSPIEIVIEHGGLKNSVMDAAGPSRMLFEHPEIEQDIARGNLVKTTINELESNIVDVVEKFTEPLFEMFDFFKIDKKVLEDVVNRYIKGEAS